MDALNFNRIPKPSRDISNSAPDGLGIYISIPFCRAKCSYCNFASGVYGGERMSVYVDRLVRDIRGAQSQAHRLSAILPSQVNTVYFGGGTPSLLLCNKLHDISQAIDDVFAWDSNPESTLECAPGQLSEELLQSLPALSFNRVSLGVQSFVDREAAAVGRMHTRKIVLNEIARLRDAGIDNINVDLIAGLPHQTMDTWRESLEDAVQTGVPHLSVYMLDVDEDSRLGREMLTNGTRYGAGLTPNEETIAGMYATACEYFEAAGIAQYEISNFTRPGWESRHNLKYWTRQPYVGFGLDAHSFLNTEDGSQIRIATTDNLTKYLDRTQEIVTPVSRVNAIEESWFLGLRLRAGVSLLDMEKKFGSDMMAKFEPMVHECENLQLLERHAGNLRLTLRGTLFANEVFERFLGVLEETEEREERGVFA